MTKPYRSNLQVLIDIMNSITQNRRSIQTSIATQANLNSQSVKDHLSTLLKCGLVRSETIENDTSGPNPQITIYHLTNHGITFREEAAKILGKLEILNLKIA